jgi:hypothetical protein
VASARCDKSKQIVGGRQLEVLVDEGYFAHTVGDLYVVDEDIADLGAPAVENSLGRQFASEASF